MRLFKPSTGTVSNKFLVRLEGVIWILIYGGLIYVRSRIKDDS